MGGIGLIAFAIVRWLMSPTILVDSEGVPVERSAVELGDDWRHRTKLAVFVSTIAAIIAPISFVVGFNWAFSLLDLSPGIGSSGPEYRPGEDTLSLILIIGGFFFAAISLLSYFYGLAAGWYVWKKSGSQTWWITAWLLPVLSFLILALGWFKFNKGI